MTVSRNRRQRNPKKFMGSGNDTDEVRGTCEGEQLERRGKGKSAHFVHEGEGTRGHAPTLIGRQELSGAHGQSSARKDRNAPSPRSRQSLTQGSMKKGERNFVEFEHRC